MISTLIPSKRSYIYIAVLSLAILGSIIGCLLGREQDRIYEDNYRRYEQASLLIGQGKFNTAQEMLNGLDINFRDTYQVQYRLGICAAALGNYDQAVIYMQKVRELRPAVLREQSFLLDFGRILYLKGEYDLAGSYLQESKNIGENMDFVAQADKMLQQIDEKEGGGSDIE